MKNKKKSIKTVKIRSDKTVKKITERYRKSVESGKEKASKELDKLLKDLSEFYGKKGGLLKKKTRSKKQRNKYNELIKDIQKYGSKGKRAARSKEVQTSETAKQLAEYFGMKGEHAKEAADIFVNYTMPVVSNGYRPSEIVLTLAEAGFDAETINNILNYIDREIDFNTPDEMKKFRTEDDVYMFVSHIASLKELDASIPVEDLIKLSEQMLLYDLNDYESVIKQYHEDEENIWNWDEEEDEDE